MFDMQKINFSKELIEYCISTITPEIRFKILTEGTTCISLSGGFRITLENCSKQVVINRFNQDFRKDKGLQQCYIAEVFDFPFMCAYVILFSRIGMANVLGCWRKLMRIAADPRAMALAIIVIYVVKGEFSRLAQLLMKCTSFWSTEQPKDSWNSANTFFLAAAGPFDENIGACCLMHGEGNAFEKIKNQSLAEQKATSSRLEEAKNTISELKAQISQLEREKAKMQRELEVSEENARKISQKCEKQLEAQRRKISEQLEKNTWRTAASLTGIDVEWVRKANAAHNSTAELIEQAKEILEEQRKRNIEYGTYDTLAADVAELQELRRQMAEAIGLSLSIHPGMEEMLKNVESECKAIQDRIDAHGRKNGNMTGVPSTFLLRLMTTIKSIALDENTPSEVQRIKDYLEHPQTMELLQQHELALLKAECDRRIQLWRRVTDTKRPDERQEQAVALIFNMERLSAKYHDITLIIDAYNAMLRSDMLKGMVEADSLAKAKGMFLKHCRKCLRGKFKKVLIVFDGSDDLHDMFDPASEEDYKIVYAKRQQDAHNADLFILNYLANERGNEACWLVTDDYGLRNEAGDAVEANVETLALHRLLGI